MVQTIARHKHHLSSVSWTMTGFFHRLPDLSLSSRFLAESSGSGHLNLVIEDDYLTAQRDVDRSA